MSKEEHPMTGPQDDDYRPVSCDFHDALEAAATLRRTVTIEVIGADGARTRRQARIADIVSRDKVEYALLDDGSSVRLDRLAAVDDATP